MGICIEFAKIKDVTRGPIFFRDSEDGGIIRAVGGLDDTHFKPFTDLLFKLVAIRFWYGELFGISREGIFEMNGVFVVGGTT